MKNPQKNPNSHKPVPQKVKKPIVVAVSGGFDPLHNGHVEMIKEAKELGDKLVVIINNNNWLKKKKGFPFMDEKERKEILEAIRYVDEVIISDHPVNPEDMSVSNDLEKLHPDIFVNGGDRDKKNAADPNSSLFKDTATCKKLGIKIVYNVGKRGKINSSSELVARAKTLALKAKKR